MIHKTNARMMDEETKETRRHALWPSNSTDQAEKEEHLPKISLAIRFTGLQFEGQRIRLEQRRR